MNAIGLLFALLVLSYVGSFLVSGRTIRGAGLPSGSEYVILGVLLGPNVLNLLNRQAVLSFDPVAEAAISWLALIVGLEFGRVGERIVAPARIVFSSLACLATSSAIAASTYAVLAHFSPFAFEERLLIAGGIGVASSETTGHAVRWVAERYGARGPLADLFADYADGGDMVPILGAAAAFAFGPGRHGLWPPTISLAITVSAGLLLGTIIVLLTRREELDPGEAWGFLLGASMLGFGIADSLGLSSLTLAFFMGMTLSLLSRHRAKLRAMISTTERPVMLPALLLAGARVSWPTGTLWIALVAVALLARAGSNLFAGLALRWRSIAAKGSGALLGAGLLSAGPLGISLALAFALRFPGAVGEAVLTTTILIAIAGEFVGPARIRAALARAGEIPIAAEKEELA